MQNVMIINELYELAGADVNRCGFHSVKFKKIV